MYKEPHSKGMWHLHHLSIALFNNRCNFFLNLMDACFRISKVDPLLLTLPFLSSFFPSQHSHLVQLNTSNQASMWPVAASGKRGTKWFPFFQNRRFLCEEKIKKRSSKSDFLCVEKNSSSSYHGSSWETSGSFHIVGKLFKQKGLFVQTCSPSTHKTKYSRYWKTHRIQNEKYFIVSCFF